MPRNKEKQIVEAASYVRSGRSSSSEHDDASKDDGGKKKKASISSRRDQRDFLNFEELQDLANRYVCIILFAEI